MSLPSIQIEPVRGLPIGARIPVTNRVGGMLPQAAGCRKIPGQKSTLRHVLFAAFAQRATSGNILQ